MNSFRGLDAWKKAMDLVDAVYDATRSFPRSEIYGLSSQLKKAAISIPSDIAEGRGRHTLPDYRHFLYEARGGTQEVETQVEIAVRQRFIDAQQGQRLIALTHEVGKLINGLIGSLKAPST
jgi:four helix bundle protein